MPTNRSKDEPVQRAGRSEVLDEPGHDDRGRHFSVEQAERQFGTLRERWLDYIQLQRPAAEALLVGSKGIGKPSIDAGEPPSGVGSDLLRQFDTGRILSR
jgi:hypothetical protein